MQMLMSNHLVSLGCPEEYHGELLMSGVSYDSVQRADADAKLAGRRISFLAWIQFMRKYGQSALEMFAAYSATGLVGVLTFIAAHTAEFPTILADFLAIFG